MLLAVAFSSFGGRKVPYKELAIHTACVYQDFPQALPGKLQCEFYDRGEKALPTYGHHK